MGYKDSFIQLERESKIYLEDCATEIQFFRSLVVEGHLEQAEEYIDCIRESIGEQESNACIAEIKIQNFLERLSSNDTSSDNLQSALKAVSELQKLISREKYMEVNRLLGLKSLTEHPAYSNWTVLSGRLDCFDKVKSFLEKVQFV